jgi:hypothetical protein
MIWSVPPECSATMPRSTKLPLLTPDDRLQQVAALLARAVLRMTRSDSRPVEARDGGPPENPPGGLEVPDESWLSVVPGTAG